MAASSAAGEPVAVAASPGPSQGPPDWWFSGEQREGESVRVCAAGFGADLPRAREAAIEAARDRLRLFVPEGAPESEPATVERLSVMPLPSASMNAARYVGYAMVSAESRPMHAGEASGVGRGGG